MGHLVNPLLYRLNYSAFWNGSLIVNSRLDNYINVFSVYFSNFVRGYFKNYNWVDKNFLFVISLKFFFLNKSIFVYVDFWQNYSFNLKNKPYLRIVNYFFVSALKKKFLKFNNIKKSTFSFNYYAWKKYYFYKKSSFLNKKINYNSFFKKFLNFKTNFVMHSFKEVFWIKPEDVIISMPEERSFYGFNHFLDFPKHFIYDIDVPKISAFNFVEENSIVYERDFIDFFYDKCYKSFPIKFTYVNLKHFYDFCKTISIPNTIDKEFWRRFSSYLISLRLDVGILQYYYLFVTLILYNDIVEKFEKIQAEIRKKEAEERRKAFEAIKKFILNYKNFKPKIFFGYKFYNSPKKFVSYSKINLLKKLKLKMYLKQSRYGNFRHTRFAPRHSSFYNRYMFKPFFVTKKTTKRKSFKRIKKSWWNTYVYSSFLKKKKPYNYSKSFKRYIHNIKNKKSFFRKFKFVTSRKHKRIFKTFKKTFKLKKNFFVIKSKSSKFSKFSKLKNFKEKRKSFVLTFRNFFKKNTFFFKVKSRYKVKVNKFYMKRKNKRKILFLKKRDPVGFKRDLRLRKFYVFNKPYFFSRKVLPAKILFKINLLRNRRLAKESQLLKDIAEGVVEDPKEVEAAKKERSQYLEFFFSKLNTNFKNVRNKIWNHFAISEKFDSFSDKIRRYWLFRYSNREKKPLKKINRFSYIKKKFSLLLKFFFFYNKIYILKKKFVVQAKLLVSFFTKINVYFFIRTKYKFQVTAELVAEFLVLWFIKKKFSVKEILGTLLNFLKKNFASKSIGGYAILMRGRFSRKDRAMYSWKKLGAMPLSHRISNVDYCNRWVPLKYSQCAFKVYILNGDADYVRKKHCNIREKNDTRLVNAAKPD